jgi:hypothetical protein
MWQIFRSAVFNGMGGLLSQYASLPGLAPGTPTGMPMPSPGIHTTINQGSPTPTVGTMNLNVTTPTHVLDPIHAMQQAAFALKTVS